LTGRRQSSATNTTSERAHDRRLAESRQAVRGALERWSEECGLACTEIAARYGWEPRRLNPALSYLTNRKLLHSVTVLSMGSWVAIHLEKTDATRRFVKGRQ
jgi:hypothetical protein